MLTAIVKIVRGAGKSLDSIGKAFEVFPYVDKRKFSSLLFSAVNIF